MRRALPVDWHYLAVDNQTVAWQMSDHCRVDVIEFEAAIARSDWNEAARLYQDDLLPDLYDEWISGKREQLRLQYLEALERLTAQLEAAGDFVGAIGFAGRLISLDTLREPSYQLLIRLHIKNGDRPSALRTYHQCMRLLRRELGISPSRATEDLYEEALRTESLERAQPQPSQGGAPAAGALVGRQSECRKLEVCWSSVATGKAIFALISGEPGIGKSRLAEEMFHCFTVNKEASGAKARCYSVKGHLAYGPIAEWLRADCLRGARKKLSKLQLGELSRVLPELLIEDRDLAAPDPLTQSWQRRHFFEAINAPFLNCQKPLLLFIDDMQWCDQESIEYLHSFLMTNASAHIMVLGTVRPEETDRAHPFTTFTNDLRAANMLVDVKLEPLSLEESTELASQIGERECDSALAAEVYRSTKGNPLFVVESTRAALEDPSGSAVPARIQSVIASRLGNLSPPAYELAGLAACIGRPFAAALLAKVTDWDEESLVRSMEELWRRWIIENRNGESLDFTHDLIREVAYAELSPFRRRALHKQIAQALQGLHSADLGPVSGSIASHYESAGLIREALGFYRLAAGAARKLYAYAEAADLIRHALHLCRELPRSGERDAEELELLTSLGLSLITTLGYSHPEVGRVLESALDLSRRSTDRKHLFTLQTGVWLHEVVLGRIERSRQVSHECIQVATQEHNLEKETAAHFILGSSLFHLGQFADARDHFERSIACRVRYSDPAISLFAGPDLGVFCWAYYPQTLWHLGRVEEAEACRNKSLELARELLHPFSLAIALNYGAMYGVFREDRELAYALADEASTVCRKHGFAYYLAFAEILAGWADPNRSHGLARLRQGLEDFRAMGAELRLPFFFSLLAEACFETGQEPAAMAAIASGFAFQNKNGEVWCEAALRRIQQHIKSSVAQR
ncbi:MAG TPA: AAA family ATPase [Fimbriimonadaceae bacterium]